MSIHALLEACRVSELRKQAIERNAQTFETKRDDESKQEQLRRAIVARAESLRKS